MSRTLVLLDCNTALHYRRADEVDWLTLTQSEEVELVATQVFLRELERQRIFNPSPKLKKRADGYVSWLGTFIDNKESVRPGVTLALLGNEPQIDFPSNGLSRDVADDHLVANALELAMAPARVMVCTRDIGLRVKLSSRKLAALVLPDDLKLPADPDPQEMEIRKLRQHLNKAPKLSATFPDGNQYWHVCFRRSPVGEIPSTDMRRFDKDLQQLDPHVWARQQLPYAPSGSTEYVARLREAEEYNASLVRYFESYNQFLKRVDQWLTVVARHFDLQLIVSNTGNIPATDIDLELYLPESLGAVQDFPGGPAPPSLPPWSSIGRLRLQPQMSIYVPKEPSLQEMLDEARPSFEPDGKLVVFSFGSLKHHHTEECNAVLMRFILGDPRSIEIRYRLTAAELPEPAEGTLRLIVD